MALSKTDNLQVEPRIHIESASYSWVRSNMMQTRGTAGDRVPVKPSQI